MKYYLVTFFLLVQVIYSLAIAYPFTLKQLQPLYEKKAIGEPQLGEIVPDIYDTEPGTLSKMNPNLEVAPQSKDGLAALYMIYSNLKRARDQQIPCHFKLCHEMGKQPGF